MRCPAVEQLISFRRRNGSGHSLRSAEDKEGESWLVERLSGSCSSLNASNLSVCPANEICQSRLQNENSKRTNPSKQRDSDESLDPRDRLRPSQELRRRRNRRNELDILRSFT